MAAAMGAGLARRLLKPLRGQLRPRTGWVVAHLQLRLARSANPGTFSVFLMVCVRRGAARHGGCKCVRGSWQGLRLQ